MKQKKGFVATSLIYSFFLVFILLMVTILSRSSNTRVLLNAIKGDIRSDINDDRGFVVDEIENKTYTLGSDLSFAGEMWKVIENKSSSVVLVLSRSLIATEILSAIARPVTDTNFYGTCNDTSCRVRACKTGSSGQEYCYLYPSNTAIHRKPSWNPSTSQVKNENYGKTIVSQVVNSWFSTHQGLNRAKDKDKLVLMSFNDGYMNTTGYIRIPLSTVQNEYRYAGGDRPFHLINSVGTSNTLQTRIYNGSVSNVNSNTDAFIRPVIEVKKG